MACRPLTPSEKQSIQRMRRFSSACLLLYFPCTFLLARHHAGTLGLLLAAVTGVLFFSALSFTGAVAYRRFDEFQRTLLTRSFVLATIVTLAVVTVWGYLQEFAAVASGWHLPLFAIPAFLVVLTALFKTILFRRNRAPLPPTHLVRS